MTSSKGNGFHISVTDIGLCKEAKEKVQIYGDVTDFAEKSCVYDVTMKKKKKDKTKHFNLLQCTGTGGLEFYLKK